MRSEPRAEIQFDPVYLHALPQRRKLPVGVGGWIVNWQDAMPELIQMNELTGIDHRVIRLCEWKLDKENWIRLSVSESADFMGVTRQSVGASLKKIIELGIILEGPSVGKSIRTFRLNPEFAWKGSLYAGAKARADKLTAKRRAKFIAIPGGLTPQEAS
jgi:hypothetical protein